ncbi:uncharacterized protein PAC_03543 [Phialocephala subalpina]|uniref:Uncharacterized protein n=1 Tax=Phialocephala subalpina TaxID=576137 RepID=A0A1L7WLM6_9HELO|nr:uncharacterized protein PAC_03543 [Phialocephala subalpina]
MAAAAVSRRLRTPPRATRAKAAISYAEDSSDSDLEAYYEAVASEPEEPRSATRSRTSRPRSNLTPQKRKHTQRSYDPDHKSTPKRRKTPKPATPKTVMTPTIEHIKGSGVVPPWQNLPYHMLVQIFQYASYPLYDEHYFQPLPSSRWLLNVAYMCRSFAEPALTVLHSSPPLVPMVQAHRLVDLLKADPLAMAYKYRQKVESLRIDVGQVAAYSLPGSGLLDLHGLIKDLPRLVDLEFYHQKDTSPYRDLDTTIKWTYPESIFDALEYVDPAADASRGDKTSVCKLKSWRWSSRLAGKKWPIEMLPELHSKLFFSSLRKIAFVNYQWVPPKKDEEDPNHEKVLAKALEALPELEHLIFESSTLVNATLLPMLPTGLKHLELINCWEVNADDFSAFLNTHGRQMRCLTLNHNQSLSLSFMPTLGVACPKLEVLRMNLTYFNLHATYHDSEPIYDKLLEPEQVPVWPSKLQIIELIQLRKWETEAAEMFFQSLLDSAESLPDLRKLTIQAILNIGWRDRSSFRHKWVGDLERVFKRVSEPPLPVISVRPRISEAKPLVPPREELKQEPIENEKVMRKSKRSPLKSTSSKNASDPVSIPHRPSKSHAPEAVSPPARRSTRTSTRNLETGKYAESSDSETEVAEPYIPASVRDISRRNALARELGILKQTAGSASPLVSTPPVPASGSDSSDSDAPLIKNKGKGKQKEFIQGMCDIMEVRIDNLRPTENQVTEADFLDEERSGDEDWDENKDNYDDGYAW